MSKFTIIGYNYETFYSKFEDVMIDFGLDFNYSVVNIRLSKTSSYIFDVSFSFLLSDIKLLKSICEICRS